MKILLSGASGFIGSALLKSLSRYHVTAIGRRRIDRCHAFYNKELSLSEDYSDCLPNINVVVHAAARTHLLNDKSADYLRLYREVNTEATLNLARQAKHFNCKRFIYFSTIGVNGSRSTNSFTEQDDPAPYNNSTLSKYEAEKGLLEIARQSNMEVVIIRPPLVYGPNPPGNFASLLNLIIKEYPLPLASVTDNKRSLIALDNLIDFILLCVDYKKTPKAANQVFIISDCEDVSTAELFCRTSKAYGKKSRLFPFPISLLRLSAKLLGKQEMADRLLGSLQVDSSKARELLGWKPVITMNKQLRKMAEADGFVSKVD